MHLRDPRFVLTACVIAVALAYYFVLSFLLNEDQFEDTLFQWFLIGIGASVLIWSIVLSVPAFFALCWSVWLPGYRRKFRDVPGYNGWPLLGNLLNIQESWHGFHEKGSKKFGPVFKLWYGAEPHMAVTSSDTCKQVLSKCPMVLEFPIPFRGEDRQMLLDGLPFAKDMQYHKTLRAAWAPAFSPSSLAQYHPIMVQHADQLVDALGQLADTDRSVDIWKLLCKVSMAVVGTCGFGIDLDYDISEFVAEPSASSKATAQSSASATPPSMGAQVMNAFQTILDLSRPSKTGFWLPIFLMLHPIFRGPVRVLANLLPDDTMARLKQSQKDIRDVIYALIKEEQRKQKEQQQQGKKSQQQSELQLEKKAPAVRHSSFLKHLLDLDSSTRRFSDAEVMANVYAFLGGGVETPANSMVYTIYQLALHPECEDRLLKEIDSADAALYESRNIANGFPYLQACFNEAMRTYSPVSKLLREATDDITWAGTDLVVPKGTKFQVSLHCAMKDPTVWKDPLQYRPERFLPGDKEWFNPDVSAFIPFGGGARLCIGFKFAQQMAKLLLAKLYSQYTFELEPGVAPLRVATGVSMAPEDGMMVRVHKRLHKNQARKV